MPTKWIAAAPVLALAAAGMLLAGCVGEPPGPMPPYGAGYPPPSGAPGAYGGNPAAYGPPPGGPGYGYGPSPAFQGYGYGPAAGGAAWAGAPGLGQGGYGHYGQGRMAQRFATANVTADGRLTLQQAQAAGWRWVARNFYAIDAQHKGYVTLADLRSWRAAHPLMHRAGYQTSAGGQVAYPAPSAGYGQFGYPGPNAQ